MFFIFKDTYQSNSLYLRTAGGANSEASPLTLPRTDGVGTRLACHAACCSSPKLVFLPLNQRGRFFQPPRAIIYGQKVSAEGKGGPACACYTLGYGVCTSPSLPLLPLLPCPLKKTRL